MPNALRNLALTVGELDNGESEFYWVILESTEDAAVFQKEVATSDQTYPSYASAMHAGFEALAEMVEPNLEDGPRLSTQAPAPNAAPEMIERTVLYKNHAVRATYRKIRRGGYVPSVAIKRGDAQAWLPGVCAYPHGGFADPKDAVHEAIRTGEHMIDGIYDGSWSELAEGGPDTGPRLRRLTLAVEELADLTYVWAIEEKPREGGTARVVTGAREPSRTYQAAARAGAAALIALADDPDKGPRG
jgi:hypothetical protein